MAAGLHENPPEYLCFCIMEKPKMADLILSCLIYFLGQFRTLLELTEYVLLGSMEVSSNALLNNRL